MPTRRLSLLALAALACTACAAPPAFAEGRLVDLQVVDRARGDVLDVWRARGAHWIAGRPGDRYAIRLTNRTGGRVLVVLSVDGVNAVSGETASTGQTGYVLSPWQTTEITGWRKSWQEAAAFYFTSLPDSYAARTDRPDNVGIIGAAVFRERAAAPVARPFEPESRHSPYASRRDGDESSDRDAASARSTEGSAEGAAQSNAARSAAPPPAAAKRSEPGADLRAQASPAPERERKADKLGTGHGEREYSPVSQAAFERATSSPAEVVQLRYDSWVNLRAAGIVPSPSRSSPQPFPGFAPDPRG